MFQTVSKYSKLLVLLSLILMTSRHLTKARQSTQINESQPLAQGYGRFGIKIWQHSRQDLVKIRSRCVPESPNLDILKRALSV
jgi:hypothetical protein